MGRQFDDKTLENLSKLRFLRQLAIHGGAVTDEGLTYLIDYPQLESFVVSCPEIPAQVPQITDKGLESIAKTKISRLFISRAAITDAGLKHLETMTTLRSLTLRDTDVTTEGNGVAGKGLARPSCYGTEYTPDSTDASAAMTCAHTICPNRNRRSYWRPKKEHSTPDLPHYLPRLGT